MMVSSGVRLSFIMRTRINLLSWVLLAATSLLSAPSALAQMAIASPTGPDSAEPHLVRGADGSVVLSWLDHAGSQSSLRYSMLAGNQWRPAVTVASGDNWFVNWADFPSVVPVSGDLWVAHWLVRQTGGTYAYDVVIAVSRDGGSSWAEPLTPHDDGTPTEHGFVSLFPRPGGVGALWLDGRNMVADGQHAEPDSSGGMTLRSAVISDRSAITQSLVVDDLVCDCCQTDVAMAAAGPVVVYRNRTENEIRDIYMARMIEGRWQKGVPVAEDGWEIAGCPVNGPAVAAAGRHVAVGWFTAAHDEPRVRFARSSDGGGSFESALDVDAGSVSGRVSVALFDNGGAVISWLRDGASGQGEFVIRSISPTGAMGPVRTIAPTATTRPAGFPQMVSDGERLIFAWTDASGEVPRVLTAIAEQSFLLN